MLSQSTVGRTHYILRRLLKIDFVRFSLVGGCGFVINLSILMLLYRGVHVSIFLAQLIGSEIALFFNFILHHKWTYKHRNIVSSIPTLLVQFHASSWAATLGSAALVGAQVKYLHLNYVVALVASSAVVLFWNYTWARSVIWRHHLDTDREPA